MYVNISYIYVIITFNPPRFLCGWESEVSIMPETVPRTHQPLLGIQKDKGLLSKPEACKSRRVSQKWKTSWCIEQQTLSSASALALLSSFVASQSSLCNTASLPHHPFSQSYLSFCHLQAGAPWHLSAAKRDSDCPIHSGLLIALRLMSSQGGPSLWLSLTFENDLCVSSLSITSYVCQGTLSAHCPVI